MKDKKREFIEYMSGGIELVNQHNEPDEDKINPLVHTADPDHTDLLILPVCGKYSRYLGESLKKCL